MAKTARSSMDWTFLGTRLCHGGLFLKCGVPLQAISRPFKSKLDCPN